MGLFLSKLGIKPILGIGGGLTLLKQLVVKGTSNRTFELDPPVYDDLRLPLNSVKVPTINPPTWTTWNGGRVLAFSDQAVLGNEEYVYFAAQLSHRYAEGEDIEVHIHWVGQDATAGNVRWRLGYSWANIGDVFPAMTTIYAIGSNGGSLNQHNYADFGFISGTGKKISSMLHCALSRNSSNVLDTFNSKSAYLLEIDFHVPHNTLGSRQEAIK